MRSWTTSLETFLPKPKRTRRKSTWLRKTKPTVREQQRKINWKRVRTERLMDGGDGAARREEKSEPARHPPRWSKSRSRSRSPDQLGEVRGRMVADGAGGHSL